MRICALALGSILLLSACEDEDRTATPIATGLKVTRKDGSRVRFSDRAYAECYVKVDGKRFRRFLHIQAKLGPRGSYWVLRRETDAIERSPELDFLDSEQGALFVVVDPVTGYELRSDDPLASGRLVVEQWGCDSDDAVRISVHGTLASDGRPKSVSRVDGIVAPVVIAEPPGD